MKLELKLSHDEYHDLCAIEDSARKKSTHVKVDRGLLRKLLRDHSKLYGAAQTGGFELVEPDP